MIEFQLHRSGILFLISAPSGGGKSTVLKEILKADPSLSYSISATTRDPREGEVDGEHYHFKTLEEFKRLTAADAFIEYASVHGNYYGTLKSEVDAKLEAGHDVILDIDVQGSLKMKDERPETVLIFILPPSIATLEKRLRSRGLDEERAIRLRLENARNEIRYAQLYDYVLVNERLERTIEHIQQIIEAERARTARITVTDALGEIEFYPVKKPSMAGSNS